MNRLVRFYPRAWRDRYGAELEDLVAARPLGVSGSIDLVRGAMDAHRHPELVDPGIAPSTGTQPVSRQRHDDLRVARRLGIGSLVGSALWLIGWVVALNGPVIGTGDDAYVDGMAAAPIILGAMVLLSGGLIGHMIRLPARATLGRMGAMVALLAGPFWAFGPWVMWLALLVVVGVTLLAVESWWSSEWSGFISAALVVSVVLTMGSTLAALALDVRDPLIGMVLFATPIWLIVGATLLGLPTIIDADPSDELLVGPAPA